MLLASCAVNQGTHDYSATNPRALRDYNAGWSYIMDAGRWTESEEAFRAAYKSEPDWIMGAALVARITQDVEEREQLLEQIEARSFPMASRTSAWRSREKNFAEFVRRTRS